jgi:LysR family transcriptional regulator, nitrogen assimilation regulatory protein
MDLRQLRYFLHVAEFGSVSKASVSLHVAQPAVSRTIRNLEAELGVALFERHGRGVRLTEPGADLIVRAERIFRDVENARREVMAHADIIEGTVTLGIPPSFGVALAPGLVGRCRQAHPRLNLRIVESYSGFVQDWLIGSQVDLAVLNARTVDKRSLKVEPLVQDRMFLVGPPDLLAGAVGSGGSPVVPLKRLAGLRLILPTGLHGLRLIIDEAMAGAGFGVEPLIEIDSVMVIKELVLLGEGLTILPLSTVQREVAAGQLRALPITSPEIRRALVIATAIDRPPGKAARAVRDIMMEYVGRLAGETDVGSGFVLSTAGAG